MNTHGMLIDYRYCTGCHACEVSCLNEKELPEGEWGIKVNEIGPVKIDGHWMWDFVPVPSDRCDCCIERLEKGVKPPCELHCLGKCLEVLSIEDITKRLKENPTSKLSVFIP
ncbi:MAG TPA: oxidoreductase [Coriobacteriia bacterium]|nr:oxidoreductase [Coriobacteriia bacterium]